MNRIGFILVVLVLVPLGRGADSAAPTSEGVEYFEKHVRPILVDSCYSCHSAKAEKLKGGLFLDSKAGVLKGGKTGPAVVPGDLDKSLLITAVRYQHEDLAMPPKKALAQEQVAALETWVKMGAPDPRVQSAAPVGELTVLSMADAKHFWSFKRPVAAAIPQAAGNWAKSPIDHFVLAKLLEKSLAPAAIADKRTLIRRAYFDVLGLPPTAEEVEAFEADNSPNAFAAVVDRLLASPHFGEKWARHWLDLARYADTKGYVFQEERRYPFAYTYRDWVINALNTDLPHDQFLIHQIAADRVVKSDEATKRRSDEGENGKLAAMGFLTLGRRFLNNQSDIIDDRIDVVTRATMGLTVACARCHDHKYDPIPAADYYSLYGVFASSAEPQGDALPLLASGGKSPQAQDYEKQLAARQAEVDKFKAERHAAIVGPLKSAETIKKYLLATRKTGDENAVADEAKVNRNLLRRFRGYVDQNTALAAWRTLAAIPEKELPAKSVETVARIKDAPAQVAASPVKSLDDLATRYATYIEGELKNAESAIQKDYPGNVAVAEVESLFNRDDRNKYQAVKQKRDSLSATHPGAPARAMVMVDSNIVEPRIFKRGNAGNPGETVKRQFLQAVAGDNRQPFKDGSGRLELAQAIASKDNPLTARVFVNRVWTHLMGKGIVRTPSDFGVRGDRPTHPELLDYLAVRFMNDGWSTKRLIRAIMLSSTYQQSAIAPADALRVDPDNKLISRQNRKRLEFEALRDSLLAVSGRLDRTLGGRPIDLLAASATRRTIYGFVDRQNLPAMFRSFDFASPDTHAPMRFTNTVPQQALYMMNSPFANEQAKALAGQDRVAKAAGPREKVKAIYQATLSRNPTEHEVKIALEYVNGEPGAWEKLAQVLLMTNEFVFVD